MFSIKKMQPVPLFALLLLSVGLIFPNAAAAQWERSFGDSDAPDYVSKVITGQYSNLLGWSIAIGGTYASEAGTAMNSNPPNAFLTYTDPLGNTIRSITHDIEIWDKGISIVELNDGSGVVWTTGFRNPVNNSFDVIVAKYNYSAVPIFTTVFGGMQDEGGLDIIQLNSSNKLIVVGTTNSTGNGTQNGFVANLDPGSLAVNWVQYLQPGSSDRNDELFAVDEATSQFPASKSDFIYITGRTNSYNSGADYDMWVVEMDPQTSGPTGVASVRFGGSENDVAHDIVAVSWGDCDGSVNEDRLAVVGETYSYAASNNDICVLNVDENLTGQWANSYNVYSAGPSWDAGYGIIETGKPDVNSDGDLVIVGQVNGPSDPFGSAFGMILGQNGGAPTSVFQEVYGSPSAYNTAMSVAYTYNLLLPYYIAGRNDLVQAGDQSLINVKPDGNSGSSLGTACAVPMAPSDNAITPTTLSGPVSALATGWTVSSHSVSIKDIGNQIDICGP